jgi:hypothetical protein
MYDSVRGKMTAIECIKVNADYESVLFHGRQGPRALNEALEFFAFYLQDLPVLSSKNYDISYFDSIRNLTGQNPSVVKTGKAVNWWGPLENPEREKWMNSKLTSFELSLREGWVKGNIFSREQVLELSPTEELLVKDPFSMSGKGLLVIGPGQPIKLPASLSGKLIVEPLLRRTKDFSHFVFPDGKMICYENLVDEKFQYRGTLFSSLTDFTGETLSFFRDIPVEEWKMFKKSLQVIRDYYGNDSAFGYSIDSFAYEQNGALKIFPLSEVNSRRTMGLMAYELVKLLGRGKRAALTLKRPLFKDAIKLSPPDVRFDIYLSFE